MPVYHSTFGDWSGPIACGSALLPIKTKVKGPAAPVTNNTTDVVDETINFFRANVLFRNFAPSHPSDLTLVYLTVWIGELLRAFAKFKTKEEARKGTTSLAMSQTFPIPGDKNFCLHGFFPSPQSKIEGENWRNYFRQVREEVWVRTLDLAFVNDQSQAQNKWWISFGKKKFMNIAST